ncbi:unnamed protein product [Haemonchus placei]|uniref:ABC transporter domain-containing protein n=1 Tax=Haemonchus placei TaxID=6290 RepID=A0A0N4WKJ4_HAEPC|nr:unnamed protein product [Haemonchus placei]
MIGFWRQMRLLLWKGVLVKSRQKFWLTVELLVPLILFIILALVRTRDFTDFEPQCHYDSKGFPSAGILPFLHSFLCSFSNDCHLSPTTGDEQRYIHDGRDKNESVIVDALYYSSQQLEWIGENPSKFSQLLDSFTQLVKILARINGTQIELPKLYQFFRPSVNVSQTLLDLGLTQEASDALATATLTPTFFLRAFDYVKELRSKPKILLAFMAFRPVPILCNETIFDSSFVLLPNITLTDEDRRSLCGVSPLALLTYYSEYQDRITLESYPSFRGANVTLEELSRAVSTLLPLVQEQPIFEGFSKWNHLLSGSLNNITSAIFCGDNPFDIATDGMGPVPTNAKTPFDELRLSLIEFIEKIVPGQQKHEKQFCHDVWLNNPLRMADFVRQQLYKYPEIADNLQTGLYGSDLRAASMNVLVFLQRFGKMLPVEPELLKSMEFALEHIFAPATDPYSFGALTKNVTETFNQYATCFLLDRFVTVTNESVMEETATCLADYQQYFSGIVVMNMTDNATEFDPITFYKIRHLPSLVDNTYYYEDNPRRVFDRNHPFSDLKYLTYGFSFLQEAVERAIIGLRVSSNRTLGMYAQQEPYPCVAFDKFNIVVFLGLFTILSFICPAALLVKNIVYEKELRLKEHMRIMGLGDMVHLWSWAVISLVLNLISTAIIAAIIKFGNLLVVVDFSLIFVFLSLFAMSSIALCLLLSTFFTNANISTAATCLIYFLFFFPFQISLKARSKTFTQFTLIFPQTTLGYGSAMLAMYSDDGKGTWKDIDSIYLEAYDVSLVNCMVAFALQIVSFILLAWYKSAVSPGVDLFSKECA